MCVLKLSLSEPLCLNSILSNSKIGFCVITRNKLYMIHWVPVVMAMPMATEDDLPFLPEWTYSAKWDQLERVIKSKANYSQVKSQ